MSTNKSENLNLHLWEPLDDFLRAEFNENFAALDAAMKEEQSTRAAAVSAETAARQAAVSQLQSAIASAGSSSSTAVSGLRTDLTEQINAVKATASAAWSANNRPYVTGFLSLSRATQSVYVGFCPSFVLLFGEKTGALLQSGASSSINVTSYTWTATSFSFKIDSGNSGAMWGESGGYLAWR